MPDPYEIFYLEDTGNSLLFSENKIKIKEFSENSGYGIRVCHAGRIGFAYCGNRKEVKNAIAQAKNTARFKAKDFTFQGKSVYKKINAVDIKIRDINEMQIRDMLYKTREGIEKFTGACRVSLDTENARVHVKNSNGLDAEYEKTSIRVYAEAMLGRGFGYSYYSSMFLPADFTAIGEEAGKMAREMQKTKKPQTGRYTVVLELEALSSILNVLLPSFSGDWKRRKISVLAGKLGKTLFSEKLNIYDDGTANASAARPFDDEGTASKRVPLVENGIIKNFLYDRETAALDKSKGTGSCARADYASGPAISPSNIVVGKGDYANFEGELNEFIIIKSLHGTHTSNVTTGDFGVEVNAGWHCKNGVKIPVRGFLVSGNVFNLFTSIEGMEKQAGVFDNLISPRIAFNGISVIS